MQVPKTSPPLKNQFKALKTNLKIEINLKIKNKKILAI